MGFTGDEKLAPESLKCILLTQGKEVRKDLLDHRCFDGWNHSRRVKKEDSARSLTQFVQKCYVKI